MDPGVTALAGGGRGAPVDRATIDMSHELENVSITPAVLRFVWRLRTREAGRHCQARRRRGASKRECHGPLVGAALPIAVVVFRFRSQSSVSTGSRRNSTVPDARRQ